MKSPSPTCQVCGQGELKKKKKYRMSGPVIAIGYIFLIPSFFGMLIGVLMIFATGSASTQTSESIDKVYREELASAGIPEDFIERIVSFDSLSESEMQTLTPEQRAALTEAQLGHGASTIGAGAGTAIAGGASLFIIFFSFVGGLIGWLLVMKKKVLQCRSCQAIVAAS